ncbi:MAG: hypothetical protein KF781_00215 [Chitinophagaceae bacterium]|nr:hypothetical protein [Chitinophagaceae bacterium]MCW5905157.1 hypothetical protein [Chitinophagaceae bacterium]
MKKCIFILILLSYSIASFGVCLNYFYCCGKLKTVTIIETKEAKNCTNNQKKDCCKNQKVHVQLQTDQQQTSTPVFKFSIVSLAAKLPYSFSFVSNIILPQSSTKPVYTQPPLYSVGANILFCTFRI